MEYSIIHFALPQPVEIDLRFVPPCRPLAHSSNPAFAPHSQSLDKDRAKSRRRRWTGKRSLAKTMRGQGSRSPQPATRCLSNAAGKIDSKFLSQLTFRSQ